MKAAIAFALSFFTTQVFAQAAGMGAVIEVCYLQFLAGPNAAMAFLTHWQQVGAMKREGISDADIDLMMRKTPARLLGLSS